MKYAVACFAGLAALAGTASAAPIDHLPALTGDYFPIHARAANHPYHVYVRLPQGYSADSERRYPVVYVLDGDSLFPIVASTHLFLTIDDQTPEAIVVGIAYGSFDRPANRRHIDFTPPVSPAPASERGAAIFHDFLKSQLIPAVDQRYRTDQARRIIFGQSRGASFVLYSAFTDPDLFWGRIAMNPLIAISRETFFGPAPATTRFDLQLVVAIGLQDRRIPPAEARQWAERWRTDSKAPWKVRPILLDHATHSANSADAYRAAMRLLLPAARPSSE